MGLITLEANLKPCPFCGGIARVTECTITSEHEEVEIACIRCGATLRRRRHQIMRRRPGPLHLNEYVPTGIYAEESAEDAWNRRTAHENA